MGWQSLPSMGLLPGTGSNISLVDAVRGLALRLFVERHQSSDTFPSDCLGCFDRELGSGNLL